MRLRTWGFLGLAVLAGFSLLSGLAKYYFARQHGLLGRYYPNTQWTGTPVKTVQDQELALHRARTFLTTNYSIEWTGMIALPVAGKYEFRLVADHGAAISIDQRLVVDNLGVPKIEKRGAPVYFDQGFFPITIRYFQRENVSALHVYWIPPGDAKPEQIPLTVLFLKQPGKAAFFIERQVGLIWGVIQVLWLILGISVILIGGFRHPRLKLILQPLLLVGSSLFFCLLSLELLLWTGWLDDKGIVWIAPKYRAIDREINLNNYFQFAKNNPDHFTDKAWEKQKPAGSYRIAVLGDSFVWGDGLARPLEDAWGHKLAQKITQQDQQIEVLNWGRPGWSTKDEFHYLKQQGRQYQPDLLIIGYVLNDPDLGDLPRRDFHWKSSAWYVRFVINPLRTPFPNAIEFLMSYLNTLLVDAVLDGYGFKSWHKQLYSPENLQRYSVLLTDLANYCQARNISLLLVFTPNSYEEYNQQYFNTLIPLLRQAKIEYLDLYPAVVKAFQGKYTKRELWANLANAHPNPLMTELFADETFEYLQQKGLLTDKSQKNDLK